MAQLFTGKPLPMHYIRLEGFAKKDHQPVIEMQSACLGVICIKIGGQEAEVPSHVLQGAVNALSPRKE